MRKSIANCGAMALSSLLLVSGCMESANTPVATAQSAPFAAPSAMFDQSFAPEADRGGIESILEARSAEYAGVIREARSKGAFGGAIRGGLIGLIIAGNPEGALAGALVGGAIGTAVSEYAASELVAEHRNYLVRRWSLEKVIEAAQTDTGNTRFDLLLSYKALESAANPMDPVAADSAEHRNALLMDFQSQAELRALTLREIMPLYATDQAATDKLLNELKAQIDMIGQMRANIAAIRGH